MSVTDLSEFNGCRALWASVLLQAIKDIDSASESRAAKTWMYRSLNKGAGSFHWICNMLELDEQQIATTCLTREGRWRILGPQHIGLRAYRQLVQEKLCQQKRERLRIPKMVWKTRKS